MGGDGAAAQVYGEIRVADVVVVEILFDVFALVAQGQDEVLEAETGIDVHDVPEYGPPADLDHGLGFDDGLFPQPGALAAAHDDNFHTASACPPRSGTAVAKGFVSRPAGMARSAGGDASKRRDGKKAPVSRPLRRGERLATTGVCAILYVAQKSFPAWRILCARIADPCCWRRSP